MKDDDLSSHANSFPAGYAPPQVWTWDEANSKGSNRPTAGATHEKVLPIGKHPHQLYSQGTPNGVKITILFEELLAAGFGDAEYDAWRIRIGDGDQFGSGFVEINPNSKIPAMMDHAPHGGGAPIRLFESGSILLYLAEKFGAFLPTDIRGRAETMNWLFWQVGSGPYLGGGFGHFYDKTPLRIQYAIDRFSMETKRQMDVLDQQLAKTEYIAGADYTIADMAIWPWYGRLAQKGLYGDAGHFLSVDEYEHVQRWTALIAERSAVQRGRMVNKSSGNPAESLNERHDASDFDLRTEDKLNAQN